VTSKLSGAGDSSVDSVFRTCMAAIDVIIIQHSPERLAGISLLENIN
jgi:hypothetical protein